MVKVITPYDRAMYMFRMAIESQEMWQSSRMLSADIREALAVLERWPGVTAPKCPRCDADMEWTATAAVENAPMEWRCFRHNDIGSNQIDGTVNPSR